MFFNGPLLTYDLFKEQWNNRNKVDVKTILNNTITSLFYIFILELLFHFIYISSLSKMQYLLEELSPMESVAVAWTELQIFLFKYIVFYRFVGIFAKLDGIVPPLAPKCISSLYTFKVMWRYFDRGLHRFLAQSIYIPLGGSLYGPVWEALSTFCCFGFVAFWHGSSKALWIWGISNWIGIICEKSLELFMETKYGVFIKGNLSEKMYRRLCAFCGSFSIYFLIYTNIIFLFEFNSATILFWNICKHWYSPPLIIIALYMASHCTIEVH